MRPGWKDWLVVAFALPLCAGGLFMLVTRRDLQSLTVATFFGLVLFYGVVSLREKVVLARSLDRGDASLPGGVVHYARRGRLYAIAGGFFLIGALFYASREKFDAGAGVIGIVSMLFGVAGLVAGIVGKRNSVALLPDGVRLGLRAGDITIPWAQVARVDVGEFASNPAVFLHLRDAEGLLTELARHDEAAAKRFGKSIASNRSWSECDFLLMPWTFGLDAAVLGQAMMRYASEPEARQELRERA